ncbi:MAG: DUF262 domain-containing protein, partial [Acidimicrobiales bacterium]
MAHLIDSLHRGYPVGSVLLWETPDNIRVAPQVGIYERSEFQIESGSLSDSSRIPRYILDGQQRLTSVFMALQCFAQRKVTAEYPNIYYDYASRVDSDRPLFKPLTDAEAANGEYFGIQKILDQGAYDLFMRQRHDDMTDEHRMRVEMVRSRLMSCEIPGDL